MNKRESKTAESRPRSKFEQRVIDAAEIVLKHDGAVGPIELLVQMQFLERVHVDHWQKYHSAYPILEDCIQCGAKKLEDSFRVFQQWAQSEGLETVEAVYSGASRGGASALRILVDDDKKREAFFRTRYQRADQTKARKKQIDRKLNKAPDLVVFVITGEGADCVECQASMQKGEWIFREQEQPLCLECADLDHLEFLPSGNATLSRRSKKFSPLSAVVVEFNRRRKRYERRGLLATPEAIEQAEQSMDKDSDQRAKQRAAAAIRRDEDDVQLIETMCNVIAQQFPGCPSEEARRIAEHTALRGSGRVGRSEAGRGAAANAVKLAVIAHIRHEHTPYDQLLMDGTDRQEARNKIQLTLQTKLQSWQ